MIDRTAALGAEIDAFYIRTRARRRPERRRGAASEEPMTYCVGLYLRDGLVLLSDTRTNAGVDNISIFSKMQVEEVPGERVLVLLSAGNLAITQAVWNRLQEGVWLDGERLTLRTVTTMFHAAQLVGQAVREVFAADGPSLAAQGVRFDISLLLGGQIAGGPPRLFLVYAAGNFIEATDRHALPADRRAQIRQADPRPGGGLRHAADGWGEAGADQHGQHAALQPDGRHADRPAGLPRGCAARSALRRRITEEDPYFRVDPRRLVAGAAQRLLAMPRPDWRCRPADAPAG